MRRPIIFVLLAGVAALVAAMVVYSALKKREAEVEQAMVKSVTVVVAAKDLPLGSKIGPDSVKLVRWSKEDVPPGAFSSIGPLMNQFTKTDFVMNEPIIGERLFSGDKSAGVMPLLIPTGMRAISVPVDEVSDIAGFVLPHSRVDLLVSVANSSNGNQAFSKIVLQNVEVLAVAQEIENATADKPQVVHVVTLLVTPEQAERVVLAVHEGPLRLAMRNYEDKKIVDTDGVTMNELLRLAPTAPVMQPQHVAAVVPARPTAKTVDIEIMRNGKSVENVSFVHSKGGTGEMTEAPGDSGAAPASNPGQAAIAPSNKAASASRNSAEGLTSGSAMPATLPAGLAPVAAANAPPGVLGAAPAAGSAAGVFNSPHAKTIDIP